MALAGTVVWEVRTTGDPANSGGFNSAAAGTDRSNQDAPHVIIDGVTITATVNATTTDLDIVGYAVSAADVGNLVRITGGTMTAGTYQINSIPAAGRWRLDRSAGVAAQTGTGRMGGANSNPGLTAAVTVAFNKVWIKAGTYSITSATQNVAGGCVIYPSGGQLWEGYQTTRGDLGTAPVLQASGINTATIFQINGNDSGGTNIEVDGAGLVAIRGIVLAGRTIGFKITARNCTNSGITYGPGAHIIQGFATGCSTAGGAINQTSGGLASLYACVARANTVTGFLGCVGTYINCISASNTGATTDGFGMSSSASFVNCVAYANGRHGFNNNGVGQTCAFNNCVAEANVDTGFIIVNISTNILLNLAAFGNGTNYNITATGNSIVGNFSPITGTSSFFTSPSTGDFSLNNSLGGGALLKLTASTGTFPGIPSTSYLDRGAVQTSGSPSGGGSGAHGSVSLGQGTWVGR